MVPQTQAPKGSSIGFVVVQGFLLAILFWAKLP
jgi:hypothetical protein